MNESHSKSPSRDNQDDKPMRSSEEVSEVSQAEADAGPDPIAEQSIPADLGLDASMSPKAGFLASLLSKISSTPIEVVRALEELRALIDERVLRAISAFRTEVRARMDAHDAKADARMDAHDAKADARMDAHEAKAEARIDMHEAKSKARADAHEAKSEARIDAHEAKSKARADALEAKVDSLRREVRLIFAMVTLVLSFLGVLVYLGYTDRASLQNASTTSATQQAETQVADAEEQTTATSIPALGTSSASEDGAAPNDDTAKTDGSSLPTDP